MRAAASGVGVYKKMIGVYRTMYKTKLINERCNICGELLSEHDQKSERVIHERLGYTSYLHDDEEHRVQYCEKCFGELLAKCKRPTLVREYPEISRDAEPADADKPLGPVAGRFCSVCGGPLSIFDIGDALIIQAEHSGQKRHIEFCNACFDKTIDACVYPSLIKDWSADR